MMAAAGRKRAREDDAARSPAVLRSAKTVFDRVHGHVELPGLLVAVMDTPQFQRLRQLKQLGTVEYVFPAATHTRFEHSIGVAHLAGELVEHLRHRQPELDVTERDVLCVKLAGLVHDLGHGPCSHLFEEFVNAQRRKKDAAGFTRWHHEHASVALLRLLVEKNAIPLEEYGLLQPREDLRFVESLVRGLGADEAWPTDVGRGEDKRFLYDIVANKRNGVDVDKLDYFLRDSLVALGDEPAEVHVDRLFQSTRVITPEGSTAQICFQDKMAQTVGTIFDVRARLHKSVYQHHAVKKVNEIVLRTLELADGRFFLRGTGGKAVSISDAVEDLEAYTSLGDWVLNAVEASLEPEMREAQDELARLRCRDFGCKLVGVADIRPALRVSETKLRNELVALAGGAVEEQDVVVNMVNINYGSFDSRTGEADHPIAHMCFYNPKVDLNRAFPFNPARLSRLFTPSAFEERIAYVYARDAAVEPAVQEAFQSWQARHADLINMPAPSMNNAVFSPLKADTPSSTPAKSTAS